MQAAFLNIKLAYLEKWNQDRKNIAEKYFLGIKNNVILCPLPSDNIFDCIWHVFVLRTEKRDELIAYLLRNGIKTTIHYPIPIHRQKAYCDLADKKFPIAEKLSSQIVSIPMYYGISEEETDYVIEKINGFK